MRERRIIIVGALGVGTITVLKEELNKKNIAIITQEMSDEYLHQIINHRYNIKSEPKLKDIFHQPLLIPTVPTHPFQKFKENKRKKY